MKTYLLKSALVAVIFVSASFSQQADTQKESTEPAKSKPKPDVVKIASFYLRDGQVFNGRVLSEDKKQITIEITAAGKLTSVAFSKKEIDTRTLDMKSMPEYQYYLDLAGFFASKTWDFSDDPDDFISTIRCLERAKGLLDTNKNSDSEKILNIDKQIAKTQNDREIWTREVKSRAELKKLEFEAEFDNRLSKMQKIVDKTLQETEIISKENENLQNNLQTSINSLEKVVTKDINRIYNRLDYLERLIDRMDRGNYYPNYYYYNRPGDPNKPK